MAVPERVPNQIRSGLLAALETRGYPLYLHGETGTGKTCIAALLYQRFLGYAAWCSCRSLLRDLAAWRADPAHQVPWLMASGNVCRRPAANAWQDLTDPDWLVCLDDVGTRPLSDAQSEIMCDLLDAKGNSPLIVTGNHGKDDLERFLDPRIVSRLCRGTVIEIKGNDKRESAQLEVSANG